MVIAIQDSGPGLDAADLSRLFSPLYRSDESRSRRTGGAGLGLKIAQGIVEAHGGRIAARNLPSGGAQFTIELPSGTPAMVLGSAASRLREVDRAGPD